MNAQKKGRTAEAILPKPKANKAMNNALTQIILYHGKADLSMGRKDGGK